MISDAYLTANYARYPVEFVRGAGARLWDVDGHEYVDFLSEFTAGIYGHSHPTILKAIAAALEGGLNFGARNATEARFAAAICARFPSRVERNATKRPSGDQRGDVDDTPSAV